MRHNSSLIELFINTSERVGKRVPATYGQPTTSREGAGQGMTPDGSDDDRRVVDSLLERLDTYGLGRRQFVKLLGRQRGRAGGRGHLRP